MDTHLENHLPLITARLVFAPRKLLHPPTITPRMVFPEIDIEARDETPGPESLRPRTPLKHATTPRHITTIPRKVGVDGPSVPSSQRKVEFVSSGSESDSDMDMDSEDNEHEIGNDHDRSTGLIPKPKGDVSRPGRGGYNLNKAVGWNQKTYDSVLLLVTRLAKERLDVTQSYRGQSKRKVAQLAETVRKEFNFMKDYANDWPVHDMLKTYLKNTSQNARNTKGKETAEKIDQIVNRSSSKPKDR